MSPFLVSTPTSPRWDNSEDTSDWVNMKSISQQPLAIITHIDFPAFSDPNDDGPPDVFTYLGLPQKNHAREPCKRTTKKASRTEVRSTRKASPRDMRPTPKVLPTEGRSTPKALPTKVRSTPKALPTKGPSTVSTPKALPTGVHRPPTESTLSREGCSKDLEKPKTSRRGKPASPPPHPEGYICPICNTGKFIKRKNNYLRHLQIHLPYEKRQKCTHLLLKSAHMAEFSVLI
ncbi:hypothetical protein O181_005442 [Austropuccinia psidii MF-1]|uniref:Uncharacterized protein n=1 Tax=Austropuccinia psidii MF-1 TaxID=1389203 RepID=A0A9Q3BI42_9BASI|nr:hypothetical protein [Austropuccinia psidii MF-1]